MNKEKLSLIYHKYGLRNVVTILVLLLYMAFGGGLFVWLEKENQDKMKAENIQKNNVRRREFISNMITVLNETDFLLLIDFENDTETFHKLVDGELLKFQQLLLGKEEPANKWGFLNSLLYSVSLITSIGYGYLWPETSYGKIATMIYALFGIPLMLLILSDLGKLLTKLMKFPWFVMKLIGRRMFRCCLGIDMEEIRKRDKNDRDNLEVFDLPLPVALGIVVGWIFVCSAIQMIWEEDWDYLVAFYFFFISLSTIGLGDIAPKKPRYILVMFANILIGLSLVSMCFNLIYSKMENSYAGRRAEEQTIDENATGNSEKKLKNGRLGKSLNNGRQKRLTTESLGVFQVSSARYLPMDLSYYDNQHAAIAEEELQEQYKDEQNMGTLDSNWSFSVKL